MPTKGMHEINLGKDVSDLVSREDLEARRASAVVDIAPGTQLRLELRNGQVESYTAKGRSGEPLGAFKLRLTRTDVPGLDVSRPGPGGVADTVECFVCVTDSDGVVTCIKIKCP